MESLRFLFQFSWFGGGVDDAPIYRRGTKVSEPISTCTCLTLFDNFLLKENAPAFTQSKLRNVDFPRFFGTKNRAQRARMRKFGIDRKDRGVV